MIMVRLICLTILLLVQKTVKPGDLDSKELKENSENIVQLETFKETVKPKDVVIQVNDSPEDNQEPTDISCCKKISNGLSYGTIAKAITYRAFATAGTIATAYIFTGNVQQALTIGGTNAAVATCLYYIYDRIWSKCSDKYKDKCC